MATKQLKRITIFIMLILIHVIDASAQEFVSIAKFNAFSTDVEVIAAIDPEDGTFWVKISNESIGSELIIHEDGLNQIVSKLKYVLSKAEEWSSVASNNGITDYRKEIMSNFRVNGISVTKGSPASPEGLYHKYYDGKVIFIVSDNSHWVKFEISYFNDNTKAAFFMQSYDLTGLKNLIAALDKDYIRTRLQTSGKSQSKDIDSLFK